jgi:hypothetical protein
MKVLNLRCASEHGFEGWFGSEDDFQSQLGRGLVECPICGDRQITRLPSAPRLNTSGAREPVPTSAAPANASSVTTQQLWLRAVQHVLENTEDVGERFPEEARRIHYGEVAQRGIRGRASSEEAQALRDEGIEVASLPMPAAVKGPVQ